MKLSKKVILGTLALLLLSVFLTQLARLSLLNQSLALEWMLVIVVWGSVLSVVYLTYRFLKRKQGMMVLTQVDGKLTKRELEVLQLLEQGLTNREIGERLFVAEITVKKNVSSIYNKLNTRRRIEAIRRAKELKILVDA